MTEYQAAIALIKEYESIKDGDPTTPNLDPYLCPTGYWTIGWGHVVVNAKGEMLRGQARKAEAYAIYAGGITLEEAEALLRDDIRRFAIGLEKLIKVPLMLNQFNALLSFAFNIGINAFAASTLLKVLNKREFYSIPSELRRWNLGTVNGRRQTLNGLRKRREAEIQLWLQRP